MESGQPKPPAQPDPYRSNGAPPAVGVVFYRCPRCSRDEQHFSCPNCEATDRFRLEDEGARCHCDQLVSRAQCECGTKVAPKFFYMNAEQQSKVVEQKSQQGGPSLVVIIGGGFIALCVIAALFGSSSSDEGTGAKAAAPTASAPQVNYDPALAGKRKTFDKKRGNNAEAALSAEGILTLLGAQANKMDIHITLKGNEEGFKRGLPLNDYRNSVNVCMMMIVADRVTWAASPKSTQKDLVAQFVNTFRTLYPRCGPIVTVNNQIRDVAEGSWSVLSGSPKVEIK